MEVSKVRRPAIVGATVRAGPAHRPAHAQRVDVSTRNRDLRFCRDATSRATGATTFPRTFHRSRPVTLEREGKLEPAEANVPLLSGDRLRTRSGGRVEVLFADGSAFTLDEESDLDLLSESLVRLLEGRMRLAIVRATTTLDYRVDAPAASVWIRAAGDYRLSARARRSEKPEVDTDGPAGLGRTGQRTRPHDRARRSGMRWPRRTWRPRWPTT